ncbi:hypothetical protein DSM104299_04504 [Baekduia alba]|uniref:hypothetical protein n=1 Tax=Baekduia alba TaxID=2997333 RepID=UPI00233FC61F|nr:hypothetical protein [Baekduia alba]WCB95754.1 hypothetical protein DSM104299_04504 [Baekduia alba]
MSQAESPDRLNRDVTVDDVRQLMGASTPHFALQLRNRIARLIAPLPAGHPARALGEQEIARLTALGFSGETRGHHAEAGMRTLRSVSDAGDPHEPRVTGGPGAEAPAPNTTIA